MGTVLWEALAGRRLFDGEDNLEVFKKVRDAEVPPLAEQRSGLPVQLVAMVHKALSVDPADRFSSSREFAMALSVLLGGAKRAEATQQHLARAVNEVRRWRREEAALNTNESSAAESTTSWEAVDIEFSETAKLPLVNEAVESLDVWFSDAAIKLPEA